MKTTPVTASDLSRSVLAVPPLARHADLALNHAANQALIRHLEAGGVSTLMYGGNANFYNIGAGDYAETVDFLAQAAAPGSWVIPSIGPDLGKMLDQVAILRERAFPTAMALPISFPSTPSGVVRGLRRVAERYGRPIIVYVKAEGFITPEGIKSLVDDGLVAAVKYAIVRPDPRQDAFLSRLVELIDRKMIVSGIGERPAIVHVRDFGLAAFTSGSVCIAPRASMTILEALKRRDYATAEKLRLAFLPLEDCRDSLSPIRVLHEAVSLAGIADMGPMLPMLDNLDQSHHAKVGAAASELLAFDRTLASKAA